MDSILPLYIVQIPLLWVCKIQERVSFGRRRISDYPLVSLKKMFLNKLHKNKKLDFFIGPLHTMRYFQQNSEGKELF